MNTTHYDSQKEQNAWRIVPDLIQTRELLLGLVWKDLRVRYRYAVMGFLWAVIEPLAFTLVLTFVFSVLLANRTGIKQDENLPSFAMIMLCGLVFWQHFSASLSTAATSVVDNKNLVKKVRFVRETLPIAACCVPLVQLLIGFALLMVAHLVLGGSLSRALFLFPLVFGIQFILTVGIALLLSCGHVHFRDVGNSITILLLFGFYGSPVFYPLSMLQDARAPRWFYTLYLANPMAGLLTAYRQILFEQRFPDLLLLFWPAICAAVALLIGIRVFRRFSATLSDYV